VVGVVVGGWTNGDCSALRWVDTLIGGLGIGGEGDEQGGSGGGEEKDFGVISVLESGVAGSGDGEAQGNLSTEPAVEGGGGEEVETG